MAFRLFMSGQMFILKVFGMTLPWELSPGPPIPQADTLPHVQDAYH